MKRFKLILLVTFIISSFSCSKETVTETIVEVPAEDNTPQTGIIYSTNAFYGPNILAMANNSVIQTSWGGTSMHYYSMAANLEKDADLKIVINNLGAQNYFWGYSVSSIHGWLISPFSNQMQTFQSINHGDLNLQMNFGNQIGGPSWGNGEARIDLYENSSSVTKSIYLYWQ